MVIRSVNKLLYVKSRAKTTLSSGIHPDGFWLLREAWEVILSREKAGFEWLGMGVSRVR